MVKNRLVQTLSKNLKSLWVGINIWIEPDVVRMNLHPCNGGFFISGVKPINVIHDKQRSMYFSRTRENLEIAFLREFHDSIKMNKNYQSAIYVASNLHLNR